MFTDTDTRTIWQKRAAIVGFSVFSNRRLQDMSDDEIQTAFAALSNDYGISYVWRN